MIQGSLDVCPTPNADDVFVLVIIGKHQPGLFISELGTLEFAVHIPNRHPHLLHIVKGIPAFLGLDVADMSGAISFRCFGAQPIS